jgi:Dyp-type peroxidase family
LLGDVRESHPRRWRLPDQNWPIRQAGDPPRPPVDLSEVDMVIQLRVRSDHPGWDLIADQNQHPLWAEVNEIADLAAANGAQLLSVQTLRRASDGADSDKEHFGFVDGISQPRVRTSSSDTGRDLIAAGDLLWGYRNGRDDPPAEPNELLDNGTFVAVRKLRQDVAAFRTRVNEESAAKGLSVDELMAKMMGRRPDGTPMVERGQPDNNDFNFDSDRGSLCPFQAHIRRANPRADVDGAPPPRIVRRGMSYGPPSGVSSAEERGTFFMAYCANLAEQYEVIQRWINGGNSTGVGSVQSDPLMGAGQSGQKRVFRFKSNAGDILRVGIPDPFVTLQWGMYLFVPSLSAIDLMVRGWNDTADEAQLNQGRKLIEHLQALSEEDQAPRWKACIEDFMSKDPAEDGDAPAIWAAIRRDHGGALRVPYGTVQDGRVPHAVLVASRNLVEKVLTEDKIYSMQGQDVRMGASFGHIYLGLDDGEDYWSKSTGPNQLVSSISEQQAFAVAHQASSAILKQIFDVYAGLAGARTGKVDLRRDFIEPALAAVSQFWFGFPDGPPPAPGTSGNGGEYAIAWGGWSWSAEFRNKPHCPGYFTSPSRYCFFPDPSETVTAYGREQGKALHLAVRDYFAKMRQENRAPPPTQPLAAGLFKLIGDNDELARTLVGIMIGFLPPTEGNLHLALLQWFDEKILWRVQRALLTSEEPDPFKRADAVIRAPLMQAMQRRPAPDTLWRLAVQQADLNGTTVEPGDIVIAGLVSATMEDAAHGDINVAPLFGGDRSADPHPVHACPGQKFAMGTMMGILGALLECGRIEAMPAPLIVRLTDWSALQAARQQSAAGASPDAQTQRELVPGE